MWTSERIAALALSQLRTLRANASERGAASVMLLCDADLARRALIDKSSPPSARPIERACDYVVIGFHFVCANEKGVTRNPDGSVWTGTWVVSELHARRASKIGAYIALHTSRSEPSYLQGVIKDFRWSKREGAKTQKGVVFLVELTDEPFSWVGNGSGERGYAWGLARRDC